MSNSTLIIICIISIIYKNSIYAFNIPIGGIFAGLDQDQEIAFRVAIDKANKKYELNGNTLTPLIANLEPEAVVDQFKSVVGITWERPYAAIQTACSFLEIGAVAMLSSLSENNANAIQSVCDAKEIPFIRTTLDREKERECCSINLFPNVKTLSDALAELIEKWNWKSFTLMYEAGFTIMNIASVLKFYNTTGYVAVLEELKKNEFGNYRTTLKNIRDSGQRNFVIHCEIENLNDILRQAQQVGLMMSKYSYIIMNLDMHTIDLSRYQHSETNIMGFQFVNPLNPNVVEIAQAMQERRKELGLYSDMSNANIAAWKMKTETALLVDALMLFVETLKDVGEYNVNSLHCNTTASWEHGSTIFNYMKMKTMNGLTGLIRFDHRGIRNNFDLDVIELREGGIVKVGTWNTKEGLNISRVAPAIEGLIDENSMRNAHIKVMIAWSEPYALYKNDTAPLTGNDQYEGFVIDLIHEIALLEGFNYTFIRNPDDKNGDYNETTKTWNGMIGDILSGTGDIAIGDLTITKQRQDFVDFTTPFMSLGVQILYKKPTSPTPQFFSFANPFAPVVWLLIGVSFCIVSLGFYIMARLSPKEWDNWDSCVQNPKFYVNQFNVRNSLWYTLGCLMQQGADIAPRGISTRVLSSVWAFFILVIVSYYKAQLCASLTVESTELAFKDLEELVTKADKLGIRYGAVENEAIHTFFINSPVKLHQKVAEYMAAHPECMVDDNYGGYLMIEEGNYAFLTDSLMSKFVSTAVCYLQPIGNPINEQNFAIAVRKGSSYRTPLSKAILKLLESGKIGTLQKRWWENEKFKLVGVKCEKDEINTVAPPLDYHHVAGIFWITFAGVTAACFWVFIELGIHIIKKGVKDKRSFLEEYKEEVKYNFSFKHSVKPMKDGKIAAVFTRNQNKLGGSSTENLNN